MDSVRRRCEARLRHMTLPDPFDLAELCQTVSARRGRPLHVLAHPRQAQRAAAVMPVLDIRRRRRRSCAGPAWRWGWSRDLSTSRHGALDRRPPQFPSQRRAPTRLAVWLTMLLLAAIGTLDLTAIGARLDAACGLPNVADVAQHVLGIVAATCRYSCGCSAWWPRTGQPSGWPPRASSAARVPDRPHHRLPSRTGLN